MIWPAFTMPMSMPARMAWSRNAECIASRTALLPRNEKDRFDTPPETWQCGSSARMRFVASMKAIAYSLCSSIPVATAKMFGSKMMSSAGKPASPVSSS